MIKRKTNTHFHLVDTRNEQRTKITIILLIGDDRKLNNQVSIVSLLVGIQSDKSVILLN